MIDQGLKTALPSDVSRALLEIQQSIAVLGGQLEILDVLEAQIRGWREWTEELDGHWSKQRVAICKKMVEFVQRAQYIDVDEEPEIRAKARLFVTAWTHETRLSNRLR